MPLFDSTVKRQTRICARHFIRLQSAIYTQSVFQESCKAVLYVSIDKYIQLDASIDVILKYPT